MRALEERAFNALPVARTVTIHGWQLRLGGGALRRANAAWFFGPTTGTLATVRPFVEALSARTGMPAAIRISPLVAPEAERELRVAGYGPVGACRAMVRSLPTGLAAPRSSAAVLLAEELTPDWLDGFGAASDRDPNTTALTRAMIAAVVLPTVYATLVIDGVAAGFGRAVIERGFVGLFDIVVQPGFRGRGAGRALASCLLAEGRRRGAADAHLQVSASNATAIGLYESLGFRTAYGYHYQEQGAPPSIPTSCISP